MHKRKQANKQKRQCKCTTKFELLSKNWWRISNNVKWLIEELFGVDTLTGRFVSVWRRIDKANRNFSFEDGAGVYFFKSQLCWLCFCWFLSAISHQPSSFLANFYLMSLIFFYFRFVCVSKKIGWKTFVRIFYLFWHSFSDQWSIQIKINYFLLFSRFFLLFGLYLYLSIFMCTYIHLYTVEYHALQTHVILYDAMKACTFRWCDREKLRVNQNKQKKWDAESGRKRAKKQRSIA